MGREEEWVQERLVQHKNPSGPFEVARQDGRCNLVHEQRMPDGVTVTIATDITKHKQTKEVLRETEAIRRSEERLRTILETSPVAIVTVTPSGMRCS